MAKRSINTKVSVSNGNQKVVEETLDHTENQTLNEKERVEVVHENIIEVLKANRSVLNEKSNSAEAKSKDETFATSELPEGANTKKINLMEHGQITKDSAGGNNVDTVSGTCTSFVEHKKVSQVDGTKESVNEIKCSNEHSSAMLLGRRKSGKFWKGERDRFRSVIKSKGLKQACAQKRIAQKEQYLRIKGYEKGLKEESKRIKEEHRQRREDNKKRKLDNEKKNEVVQIIKNTAKIKRMKKKQLRMLAKRDVAIIQR